MLLDALDGPTELSATTIAALQKKWKRKDVSGELHAMHLWLVRYQKRRPKNLWRFIDRWLAKAPDSLRVVETERPLTLPEQRKRNMDEICGVPGERVVNGMAERVGPAIVQSVPRLVRESGGDGMG